MRDSALDSSWKMTGAAKRRAGLRSEIQGGREFGYKEWVDQDHGDIETTGGPGPCGMIGMGLGNIGQV